MTVVTITGGIMIDKLIKSTLISTTVGRKLAECSGTNNCCLTWDEMFLYLILLQYQIGFL
jgi:hypothetical protein